MVRENKQHGWLVEALFAMDRFPETSNVFHIGRKYETFCHMQMDIPTVSRRAACYAT